MATTQYIGARYVPLFFTNPDDNSNNWKSGVAYDPLTVVTDLNQSYTSKIPVPASVGRPSENPAYWILTGAYNNQVEQYRQEVENYKDLIERHILAWINALDIGCVNDGVTDNTGILNTFWSQNPDKILYFPEGQYALSGEVDSLGGIVMDWNAEFLALQSMDCMVHVNKNFVPVPNGGGYPAAWNHRLPIYINCNANGIAGTGVRTDKLSWADVRIMIENPTAYGVYVGYNGSDGDAENEFRIYCYCDNRHSTNSVAAVYINSNDNNFPYIFADTVKYGAIIAATASIGTIHHWTYAAETFPGSATIVMDSPAFIGVDHAEFDTTEYGILFRNSALTGVSYLDIQSAVGIWNSDSPITGTFKILGCSGMNATCLQQTGIHIRAYRGNSAKTSGAPLVDGDVPFDTELNYPNDFRSPFWNYDFAHMPQGTWRYSGDSHQQGSPADITAGTYIIRAINNPYGKELIMTQPHPSSNTARTVFYRTIDKWFPDQVYWAEFITNTTRAPRA